MAKGGIYSSVKANHPRLNRFDLSHTHTFSAKIGLLYPVQCDEVVPGDFWKMSNYVHAELMPLVAPVMADFDAYIHTFFVPYRLLYGFDSDGHNIWELFITGGKDGTYNTPLPAWSPSWTDTKFSTSKIWDYLGFPCNLVITPPVAPATEPTYAWTPLVPAGCSVSIAPKRAYNFIYNSFYRDEFLVDEVSLDSEELQHVAFKKDYFTSALEHQSLGPVQALPVDLTGVLPVTFTGGRTYGTIDSGSVLGAGTEVSDGKLQASVYNSSGSWVTPKGTPISGSVDASGISGSSFTIADLRVAFATQRLQELTQKSGYRYTEFLGMHYGVNPTDARLDRPEYIGGCKIPVTVSTSIQNSSTEKSTGSAKTPQGNKVGVGQMDSLQKIGNYKVLEHGLIMTLLSIRPKPIYQQGINRQWLRETKEEFYFPEFFGISEVGIKNAELYIDPTEVDSDGNPVDAQIFGFQGAWNEMRSKNSFVSGSVREQFDYWTTARKFANRPALNQDFIEIVNTDFNRIFAVENEDEFIISYSSLIDAYRPIPLRADAGLVDHVYGR